MSLCANLKVARRYGIPRPDVELLFASQRVDGLHYLFPARQN